MERKIYAIKFNLALIVSDVGKRGRKRERERKIMQLQLYGAMRNVLNGDADHREPSVDRDESSQSFIRVDSRSRGASVKCDCINDVRARALTDAFFFSFLFFLFAASVCTAGFPSESQIDGRFAPS